MTKEVSHIKEYEFSAGLRWTHWIRFLAIIALVATGFYLSYVFITPEVSSEPVVFLNAKIRMWHEIIGFVLIAVTLFKTYLFLFDIKSRKELFSFSDFLSPKVWITQIKYYLFIGEHPKLKGVYNPVQFVAYITFYIVLFLICITGLVLYVHVYHEGLGGFLYEPMRSLELSMGGIANVRAIHHIAMWVILIFVPAHVYMVIFNSIKSKDGTADAIFSGYKFPKDKH